MRNRVEISAQWPKHFQPELAHRAVDSLARWSRLPEWDADYLDLVIAAALKSESYIKALQDIAKYAGFLAQRRGHRAVTEDDLEDAIAKTCPALRQERPKEASRVVAPALPAKRPARGQTAPENRFSDRSLQPVCSARSEIELVEAKV